MKLKLLIAGIALFGMQMATAQETVVDSVAVQKEKLEQQLKEEKQALKEQERIEKERKDAEKKQKDMEERQEKLEKEQGLTLL